MIARAAEREDGGDEQLKYILLDDGSTSLLYARLLIELVVNPIMKWLNETWTLTRFPQQEQLV